MNFAFVYAHLTKSEEYKFRIKYHEEGMESLLHTNK